MEEAFPDLMILEGGSSSIGIESTIVDLTGETPILLRPGGIPQEALEDVIGFLGTPAGNVIKAPGMLQSHYAPHLPLRLNAHETRRNEAFLAFGPASFKGEHVLNLSPTGDLTEAAANLFKMLRLLDHSHYKRIAVAPIPLTGLGMALNDRLCRAAAPRVPE